MAGFATGNLIKACFPPRGKQSAGRGRARAGAEGRAGARQEEPSRGELSPSRANLEPSRATPSLAEPTRAGPPRDRVLQKEMCLVYVKRYFFSCLHFLSSGQRVGYRLLPGNCTLQTSVSSTRNANFQKHALSDKRLVYAKCAFSNQVSSRLCETLLYLTNCHLAYAKHLLWAADQAI